MPELPEVETVRLGLARLLPGRVVSSIMVHESPKSFPNADSDVNQFLVGATVQSIDRRGKALIVELSSGYSLFIHLKMTGQLVFVGGGVEEQPARPLAGRTKNEGKQQKHTNAKLSKISDPSSKIQNMDEVRFGAGHPNESLVGPLPDRSTRVTIAFTDGSHLYFNDQRKFGWIKLLPSELVAEEPFMKNLGPEPLEPEFTHQQFIERVRRRAKTNIKAALLDQSVLAGVGNIYADESLWGAKIHPSELVGSITDARLKKLHEELLYVLKLSIEKGGSTDKNYVNAEGKRGSYLKFARVFRREKLPCPRCGTIIEKSKVAGRGTHTCPSCQKL